MPEQVIVSIKDKRSPLKRLLGHRLLISTTGRTRCEQRAAKPEKKLGKWANKENGTSTTKMRFINQEASASVGCK